MRLTNQKPKTTIADVNVGDLCEVMEFYGSLERGDLIMKTNNQKYPFVELKNGHIFSVDKHVEVLIYPKGLELNVTVL